MAEMTMMGGGAMRWRGWGGGLAPGRRTGRSPMFLMARAAVLRLLVALPLALVFPAAAAGGEGGTPPLMRGGVYHDGLDPGQYWISEKLDGVRAYWNGERLVSRRGNPFPAPAWFTAGFPATPLDGELWMGRGTFARLSGAVRRREPRAEEWRKIRFMVFDLPAAAGPFDRRLRALRDLVNEADSPYLQAVAQFRIADRAELMARLRQVVRDGGEGLMLHRGDAYYRAGRSDDLLKLKEHQDAEARVVGHLPGKGKFTGMLGALLVETPEGLRFRLGTGFSNQERRNPPPLGAAVTYKHYGKTENGVPRFAVFLRVREEY